MPPAAPKPALRRIAQSNRPKAPAITSAEAAKHALPPGPPLSSALAAAAQRLLAVLSGESLAGGASVANDFGPEVQRAQVHELLYGTLRRFGEGDAILSILVDRTLDPPLRALLLVALYRLRSKPDTAHTTVNQAVAAAELCGVARAGGLVNGVLRNYLRQGADIELRLAAEPVAAYAHPAWWLHRLQQSYPADWPRIVAADNQQPPITLRINVRRQTVAASLAAFATAEVTAEPLVDWPQAVRLSSAGRIDRLPGFAEGYFSVQDPGAQRAAILLDLAPGLRVLDACAAPGGKTTHMLELCDVSVTALDIEPVRCRRIEENLSRLGLAAQVLTGDAARPSAWWDGRLFDRILADVPCTASGVVRRHPDAKWLRRETDIAGFVIQQRTILKATWPLLAPGGKYLYATCSLFPEENDHQVDAFCAAHPDARLIEQERWLPDDTHDGFFYALLEKISV